MVKNINNSLCSEQMLVCEAGCTDQSSSPRDMVAGNGKVYFFAQDATGVELWESDGTTAGTLKISTLNPHCTLPHDLVFYNGLLYFAATTTFYGEELIRFNTVNRSYFTLDIFLGQTGSRPQDITVFDGKLVFSASVKTSSREIGRELVYYDGVNFTYKDINPGSQGSNPSYLKIVDSSLYFSASANNQGVELWEDLAEPDAVPRQLADVCPGACSASPRNMTKAENKIYFTAFSPDAGVELCRYDPLTFQTEILDLYQGAVGSSPEFLVEHENGVYFSADINTPSRPSRGRELARYSGSTLGVNDLVPGPGSSNVSGIFRFDGLLYFIAGSPSAGYELWRRDINKLTGMVKDVQPGPGSSMPRQLRIYNDTLFFTAYRNYKWELWKTKGTVTTLAADLNGSSEGSGLSGVSNLIAIQRALFLVADNGFTGKELWKYTSPHPVSRRETAEEETAEETMAIHVYPNPFTDEVTIYCPKGEKQVQVTIYNALGMPVFQNKFQQETSSSHFRLHVSHLPPGSYILQCVSENKTRSFVLIK